MCYDIIIYASLKLFKIIYTHNYTWYTFTRPQIHNNIKIQQIISLYQQTVAKIKFIRER